jgi:uncharacterized protein involved in exopolysaccharide biosynthesis
MRAYRETFRKHRILYCVPPVLAALALGVLAFGGAKKYQSQASLWIDNGPQAGSSLSTTSGTQPSSSEQTLLNELVATKSFALDVANHSLLKQYITAQGGSRQQIESKLAGAVSSGTTSTNPGPQILVLTFTGPTPAISQSALQSLITHLQGTMTYYGQTFGQSAKSYYQDQVKTATQNLTQATAASLSYKRSHPGATVDNDQQYAALVATQQSANGQLATATSELNQAVGQAAGNGINTLVRVVDPASVPTNPTSGKKSALMKVGGGLFAGLLLSAIIIVAKTPSRQDRWDDEISGEEPAGVLAAVKPVSDVPNGQPNGAMAPAQAAIPATDGAVSASAVRPGVWALQRRILNPQQQPPASDGLNLGRKVS